MTTKHQKHKKKHGPPSKSSENLEILSSLDLKTFNSKKLYEVEMIIPRTTADIDILGQIVAEGKKFESLSSAYFITYSDVIDFVHRVLYDKEQVFLPVYLKDFLFENKFIKEKLNILDAGNTIEIQYLAIAIKMTIIEMMYKIYITEVSKMKKRQSMKNELNILVDDKECHEKDEKPSKGKKLKNKSSKSTSSKSSAKAKNKRKQQSSTTSVKPSASQKIEVIKDYTEISLEENDIIHDYNLNNQTIFILLVGFLDPLLLKELSNARVFISAITEITANSSSNNISELSIVLSEIFKNAHNYDYLKETAFMKFNLSEFDSIREALEEFLYVAKEINYIKLQHLLYLKHLELFKFGKSPKRLQPKCLIKYNSALNDIPLECINISIILNALIEEICWREMGQIYSVSNLSLDSKNAFENGEDNFQLDANISHSTYQAHEEDDLFKILNSYEFGRAVYDITLKYLNFLMSDTINIPSESPSELKSRGAPSETFENNNVQDVSDHIHLVLFQAMKHNFISKKVDDDDFTRNLMIYDENQQVLESLPQLIGHGKISNLETQDNILQHYQFKENISLSVLLQLLFKSSLEFSVCDKIYSPITDTVLMKFHDNLDEHGIQTNIYNESLNTTVCLRDFCKYVSLRNQKWFEINNLNKSIENMENRNLLEECQGATELTKENTVFEDYGYLLTNSTNQEGDKRKSSFHEMMHQLISYPKNVTSDACPDSHEKSFYGYDLGEEQIQLQGASTIFHSYDEIKVIVDNSRFLKEAQKCRVKIIASGNMLTFYSSDSSNFHFVLKDESIIFLSKRRKDPSLKKMWSNSVGQMNKKSSSRSLSISEKEIKSLISLLNLKDFKVKGISHTSLPEFLIDFKRSEHFLLNSDKKMFDKLLELFKAAIESQKPIYKLDIKPPTRYVRKNVSTTKFPFAGIIRRVLCKTNSRSKFKGHCIRTQNDNVQPPSTFDIKITIPNGLSITALPKTTDLVEIKQSNKWCKSKEEYRLFYKNGVVLVKNVDGTTKIMRSNGDLIDLTDIIYEDKNCSKNMVHLFSKTEDINKLFFSSRTSHQVKSESDFKRLYEFGEIPYAMKTILSFNGKQTIEFKGKITQRQLYYVIHEEDYYTEETCFKRDDGFRCIVDKKGKREIQFPDGTKICSWYEIEKELIFVDDHVKGEGWVSVSISYEIEHPNYVSLIFDGRKKSTQIFYGTTNIKILDEYITLSLGDNISTEISAENILLIKSCESCNLDSTCKIDLIKKQDGNLVEVYDTYDKHFTADYFGNCSINLDYIKGSLNKENCDHRSLCDLQHLFTLNGEKTAGSLLWTYKNVENKLSKSLHDQNVQILNYFSEETNRHIIEFYTKMYKKFPNRFLNFQFYQDKIDLPKNLVKEKTLYYVMFRIFHKIQDPLLKEVKDKIIDFFENNRIPVDLLVGLKKLLTFTSADNKLENIKTHSQSVSGHKLENKRISETLHAELLKKESTDQMILEIISAWRKTCTRFRDIIKNKRYVPYFHSNFYLKYKTENK